MLILFFLAVFLSPRIGFSLTHLKLESSCWSAYVKTY